MTDPFSIAVGVGSVVSLSIQLVEGVHKLSSLLRAIRDLPAEVESMLTELEILSGMLEQSGGSNVTSVAGKKTTQQLQRVLKLLRSVLVDTHKYLGRARHKYSWKAIKASMKKQEIERLYQRMQHCLRLLQVVNQIDFHATHTAQFRDIQKVQSEHSRSFAMLLQLVSNLSINQQSQETPIEDEKENAVISETFEIPKKPKPGTYWDLVACCWIIIGLIQLYQTSSKKRHIMNDHSPGDYKTVQPPSWKMRFQPARWLTSRGFTIWRTACFGDWQYQFRPHRLRPLDAPIFIACEEGRFEDVHQMLLTGQASPFDMNVHGWTPLHYAVQSWEIDVCRLLISNGADCNESCDISSPNLLTFFLGCESVTKFCLQHRKELWYEIVKLLVDEGHCDPTLFYGRDPNYLLFEWEGPEEPLKWLCRSDSFWFNLPVDGGPEHIYHDLVDVALDDTLLDALWTKDRIPYILNSKNSCSETVLFVAVEKAASFTCIKWCPNCREQLAYTISRPDFNALVTRLIKGGSNLHALDINGNSLLSAILGHFLRYYNCSPFGLPSDGHSSLFVFTIEPPSSDNEIIRSPPATGTWSSESYGSEEWRLEWFLNWWFEKLHECGCDLSTYIRNEESQLPLVLEIIRDDVILEGCLYQEFYYDKLAQRWNLSLDCTWQEIGDAQNLDPSRRKKLEEMSQGHLAC